ncbi:ribonuclease H-like domain-containing protein [Tanacetum coccineum]
MSLRGYSDGEYDDGSDVDNVTLISKLDVSHPLHLHPNDSMTLTVDSVKLKGTENYQVWSCAMLLALEGKSKTKFIDGSCRRSNTDEVLGRQWDRVNDVVLGAKYVWDELKETYDKVDGSVTFGLHHKIHTLSQNGSSIADYYHKMNALWKQFDALIKLPRCTCHAADDFKKHNQLMKLMQFLMGLDDTYMQIRSSILSRETLPDVRNAYVIIFSEESHMIATGSVSGTSQRPNDNGSRRTTGGSTLVKAGSNLKGKNVSNNVVGSSSSNGFSDEQMATLISLIKENSVNGKGVHSNMAGGIPLNMWSRCVLTATYLINKFPTSVLNGKSPYDLVYNKPPSLKHLRSFGCLAYATILNSHEKFGSRSEKCVLVGYSNSKKGYKLWSLDNKQIIYSRQGSKR